MGYKHIPVDWTKPLATRDDGVRVVKVVATDDDSSVYDKDVYPMTAHMADGTDNAYTAEGRYYAEEDDVDHPDNLVNVNHVQVDAETSLSFAVVTQAMDIADAKAEARCELLDEITAAMEMRRDHMNDMIDFIGEFS